MASTEEQSVIQLHGFQLAPKLFPTDSSPDDSGTDGSDTVADDTLTETVTVPFEDNISENIPFAMLGQREMENQSAFNSPHDCTQNEPEDMMNYLDTSTSYHNRTNMLSLQNLSNTSPRPLKSILSRTPSPRMSTDKNTSPTSSLPKIEKTTPKDEDNNRPFRPKFCSVGSLDIPDIHQILPPSQCNGFLAAPYNPNNYHTLPHRRSSSLKPSKLIKSRSLSLSESCLSNGSLAGSHFDVVYIKDLSYSGSQKPNVATVKEEEEAVSSNFMKLMDDLDNEDSAKEKYVMRLSDSAGEDTDTPPPKPVTKNKVMFSELAEVCSFVSLDDSGSETDSESSTPEPLQLIPGWSPKKQPSALQKPAVCKPQVDKGSPSDSNAGDGNIKLEKVSSEVRKTEPSTIEKQLTTIDLITPTAIHDGKRIDNRTSTSNKANNMNNSNAKSLSPVIKEPVTSLLASSITSSEIHHTINTSLPVKQLSADQPMPDLTESSTTTDEPVLSVITLPSIDQSSLFLLPMPPRVKLCML